MSKTNIAQGEWLIGIKMGEFPAIFTTDGEYIGTCRFEDSAKRIVAQHNKLLSRQTAVPDMIRALEDASKQEHHRYCRTRKNTAARCDCNVGLAIAALRKAGVET